MLPGFRFITGVGSLIGSLVLGLKEDSEAEEQLEKESPKMLSRRLQFGYDYDGGRWGREFNLEKMKAAIKWDHPNANDILIFEIAQTAAKKKLFEEETGFDYELPRRMTYVDLEKYITDEFRLKKGGI